MLRFILCKPGSLFYNIEDTLSIHKTNVKQIDFEVAKVTARHSHELH